MSGHCKRMEKKSMPKNKSLLILGFASLLWFLFRTGTKPSRIVYPCQRAALANSSMLLSASIPLSLATVFTKTKKFLSSKKGTTLALLIIVAVVISGEVFWGSLRPAVAVNPNQEIQLTLEPRNATSFPASDLYVVNGRTHAHINELINLMGFHGLRFYKSGTTGVNQGPDGLIARDDVVLIKINMQWPERGGTNTDVLKELIQAIVDHPDAFVGEIVVADNGQGRGSMDWPQSNAENITQSTQDVVNMFSATYNVSTFSWEPIRYTRVNEYSAGDMTNGYVVYTTADPETGIYVSYPKFRTQFGTYISFKYGIWNGTGYEKRLKVINIPVLKSHGSYGVTASLKHYMGVQTQGLANGHSKVATGGMGTLMVETGLPTLNIIEAIWVNANPPPSSLTGPSTPYNRATRVNVIMASTDPVALDYWAAKHVLVQTAHIIGYNDTHTLDPDSTDRTGVSDEAFGIWLNLTKNEILAGGYNVTTDENHMNVYINAIASVMQTQFTLTTLYEVNLYVNGTIFYGNNLTVKFYSYSDVYEGQVTVWTGTPTHVILSVNVSHPLGFPVEIVTLVLTDNLGTILQTVTSFVVHRSHLMGRLGQLDYLWTVPSANRPAIMKEYVAIDGQWPYAPT